MEIAGPNLSGSLQAESPWEEPRVISRRAWCEGHSRWYLLCRGSLVVSVSTELHEYAKSEDREYAMLLCMQGVIFGCTTEDGTPHDFSQWPV
jgi:hypothetical protein